LYIGWPSFGPFEGQFPVQLVHLVVALHGLLELDTFVSRELVFPP